MGESYCSVTQFLGAEFDCSGHIQISSRDYDIENEKGIRRQILMLEFALKKLRAAMEYQRVRQSSPLH